MNTRLHHLPPAYVKENGYLKGIQESLCPPCPLLYGEEGGAVPKQVNRTSNVLAEIATGRSEQSLALPTGRIFAEFQKPTGSFAA